MENIETTEKITSVPLPDKPLSLTFAGEDFLKTGAQWAQFLSIVMFCMTGVMIVLAVLIMVLAPTLSEYQDFSGMSMGSFGFTYLVMAVIYFFPALFQYRFATGVKSAIKERDEEKLNSSLNFFKKYNLYMGILTIIMLGITLIVIIVMVVAFSAAVAFGGI